MREHKVLQKACYTPDDVLIIVGDVIHYFDCEVELLSEDKVNDSAGNKSGDDDIAWVRQTSSGRKFRVPKSFLYQNGDKYYCSDYTDALLAVDSGDTLSVIAQTSGGYIAKKDGVTGWYCPSMTTAAPSV